MLYSNGHLRIRTVSWPGHAGVATGMSGTVSHPANSCGVAQKFLFLAGLLGLISC